MVSGNTEIYATKSHKYNTTQIYLCDFLAKSSIGEQCHLSRNYQMHEY